MKLLEIIAGSNSKITEEEKEHHIKAIAHHSAIIENPLTHASVRNAAKIAVKQHQNILDSGIGMKPHNIPEHMKPLIADIDNGMSAKEAGEKYGLDEKKGSLQV